MTDHGAVSAGPTPSPSSAHVRRVASGAATYAAASVLQRATPFILLPVFTRILDSAEFGQVGILTTMAAAVTVVLSLGLEPAIFRGYLREPNDVTRRRFVTTVGGFTVAASIIVAMGIAMVFGPPAASALKVPTDALRFAAMGASLGAASAVVPMAVLRAQERKRDYLRLTALQVIVTPTLTLIFVAALHLGATGWMLALMISNALLLVRGLGMIRLEWAPSPDVRALRTALAFGLPLLPHALAHWSLSVSDRAILGAFLPAAAVGPYFAAYVLSLPVTLAAIAVSQGSQPLYIEAAASNRGRQRLSGTITGHITLTAFVTAAVATLGPGVQQLVLPPQYASGADLVPWLALGAGLFGAYLVPMNVITLTVGRTSRVGFITLFAALTNVALNIALIPRFGVYAAAVNTTIGYGILLIGVSFYARRVCDPPIDYEVKRIVAGLAVIVVPAAATMVLTATNSVAGIGIRAAMLVAVGLTLAVIGPLRGPAEQAMRAWRSTREADGR